MKAEIKLVILPYDSVDEDSILDILVQELTSDRWNCFQAAVAFVKDSAMFENLLEAIKEFVKGDRVVKLTCGADVFGINSRGSDYNAIQLLLEALGSSPNTQLHLYHEGERTFHPKLYLFTNEQQGKALLIIGSSNLSKGGLIDNIEANVVINLDLSQSEHRKALDKVESLFTKYWTES